MNTYSDTSDQQIFVGIDVAKDSLAIFIDSTQTHSECPNQTTDLTKLARRLKKLNPTLIVLEATGGYEMPVALAFTKSNLPFAIVYPRRVRQFANSLGIIAKTDKIDAKTIAYYGKVARIEPKPLVSDELRLLRALTTRRSQLLEICLTEENRLATVHPSMQANIKQHLIWMKKQIQQIETDINNQIKESETWHQTREQLQTVPGVGGVLSSILITQLPELGEVSDKEIAALVGIAPFPSESGRHKGKRFCKGGRNSIRRVLYMATICATRHNPVIKQFYENLCNRGKLKKVAIIACARKLLVILNAMVRDHTNWQPNVKAIST